MLSFDLAEERQEIDVNGFRAGWSEDRLRILRLKQAADAYLPDGAVVSGEATLSFGLDALGARHATPFLPLSRAGASPDFVKLEVTGSYRQSLLQDQLNLTVSAKAQTSFGDPMVTSEQFGIGGFDWLSSFGSGSLQGDTGAAFRAELAFPQALDALSNGTVGAAMSPYLFGAAGIVKLEEATAVEDAVTRAAAFGVGLRFGLAQRKACDPPTSPWNTVAASPAERRATTGSTCALAPHSDRDGAPSRRRNGRRLARGGGRSDKLSPRVVAGSDLNSGGVK